MQALAACVFALAIGRTAAAEPGHFVDDHGKVRSFEREYRAWIERREPHYLRAAIEMVILTAGGTVYYWSDPLANKEDWDDPSIKDKLTGEAVRFDNNLSSTNFLLHPGAGAAFYGFSRFNGLSIYASAAYGATASLLWEFAFEWREKVSINDLVFTPIGGIPIGEFFFRLGDYFTTSRKGAYFGNYVARYTLGLPKVVHDAIDDPPSRDTGIPTDSLGFTSAIAHAFSLGYGYGALENDTGTIAGAHRVALKGELAAMPGFLRPGRFSLFYDEGNFTEANARALFTADDGLAEFDGKATAWLLGYYTQAFTPRGGSAFTIALSSGFRYLDSWRLGRRDQYYVTHLPGPAFGIWARKGRLAFEGRIEGHPDFAGMSPLAYPEFRDRYTTAGLKSVLTKQGYAFDWCASGQSRIALGYLPFSVGGAANAAHCRSIQGHDRVQEEVTRDVVSTDDIVELRAWAAIDPPVPFQFRVEYEERLRWGSMGPVRADRRDRWFGGVIDYVF